MGQFVPDGEAILLRLPDYIVVPPSVTARTSRSHVPCAAVVSFNHAAPHGTGRARARARNQLNRQNVVVQPATAPGLGGLHRLPGNLCPSPRVRACSSFCTDYAIPSRSSGPPARGDLHRRVEGDRAANYMRSIARPDHRADAETAEFQQIRPWGSGFSLAKGTLRHSTNPAWTTTTFSPLSRRAMR